jgi:hypothetical protein
LEQPALLLLLLLLLGGLLWRCLELPLLLFLGPLWWWWWWWWWCQPCLQLHSLLYDLLLQCWAYWVCLACLLRQPPLWESARQQQQLRRPCLLPCLQSHCQAGVLY